MSEQKLDEVDGEFPVSKDVCRQKLSIKNLDLEKSLTDSGMDEGSNSGSLDTGDNSDDDDVVLRKPKKSMQRILDDDSDMSQDAPVKSQDAPVKSQDNSVRSQDNSVRSQNTVEETSQNVPETSDPRFNLSKEVIDLKEKRKQEFTPEQALDVILQDSSEDSDRDDTPAKKKRVKRPVADSSSDEDENVSLMDTIQKHTAQTGTEDLFNSEKTTQKEGNDSGSDQEDSKRKIPDNLFNDEQDSDSDSSGCKSSGSEVERSDNEQGDEGFDESSVDPKLLAKLKKGAAKKPKQRSKREELQSIHSESQRLVRESRVHLPYHQPAPRSINDFLERANRKQHEYKVLRGFRDTTKANLMQDILQKARIQSKAKTQEEFDKYSDSDEDWNPDEEKEKNLKSRIDERMRKKSGVGMPLGEIKLNECAQSDNSNQSSVINEVDDNVNDDGDELPDIGDSIERNDKDVNKLKSDTECVENEKSTESFRNENLANTELAHESDVICVQTSNDTDSECVQNESESLNAKDSGATEQTEDMPDDLLYDWEKNDVSENKDLDKTMEKDKEFTKSCGIDVYKSDENKENVDPNVQQSDKSNIEQVLTPSRKNKSSPRSSTKKKKSKLAALAGIDLDSVKPCLSGNTDTFVTLEDSVDAPKNPGVQKLMDRLTKHSTKPEKKHNTDTDISIISKDTVGIDKEELKLNTFTYHSQEEETNPLLKLETPGAKLVALKEKLQEKMKERREMARQKRQEVYDLDNEEGGYEAEEAEMSEHSDTDVEEDDDFEEQFGGEEEEEETEEKEKNPFADDEAEDDGDNEEVGNIEDEFEEDDEYNLRLDVSDEEQSEAEEDDDEKNSKSAESDEETEDKPAEFKEPKEPTVPEKPFSIFGKKGRGNSFSDTQFPSGQTKTSLTMPIEDSQDLYNSVLPEITHTQSEKPVQQSQDFSFFLEDSQSNMLDADGYIKTKSTGKKKQPVPVIAADDISNTQNNMDELLGLCSGRFMESQTAGKEKTSKKSLFDESSSSNTQGNMEEFMGLCSGIFKEKSSTQAEKKGTKRTASDVESDEDSVTAYSDTEDKHSEKDGESDNEAENSEDDAGDTDHIDSEDEEEKPEKFSGFTLKNKHGKIRHEFVEAEAELSGSEYDSDENLDLAEEEDIMEIEEGDKEAAKMDQDQLRDEVGRIHLKQLIDEDKRELLRYQEMYLQDGDLYSEGGGRTRRFKWSNMEDDSQQDMFNDGSDGEEHQEETEDFTWRKERYEREQFLKQQEMENNEGENSQFLKLGKVFLKKQGSVDTSVSEKGSKPQDTGAETPGFPGSFYKLPQQKRGSFLARSKEALAKIAEMTKPVVNPSAGAKSSGKFTFHVISPDKEKTDEKSVKGKQRKAHVPKQLPKEPRDKRPPAKRPKLDTRNSFTENSIFHLI